MKKYITTFLVLLLILSCIGCSNNSNTQSNQTESSNSTSSNSTSSNTTDTSSVIGDWEYKGNVNGKNYSINLDLENNNEFELDVDEENTDDDIEAEVKGSYTAEADKLILNVVTLQNNSDYLTGTVVQNAQIELKYKLTDNNTLELSNANDVITFIPAELTLTRDT